MKPPRIEPATPDLSPEEQHIARKRLPRGATSLPKDVALAEQRARLIHAVACAVIEKGYVDTTVSDIIRLAGVSRATFYELYADKEDCFLDGYKVQSSKQFDLVVKAFDPDAHFADQMIQAFTIYIKMIDAAPIYARAFTTAVEVFTPRVREVFEEIRAAYCAALKTWFLEVRHQYPEVGECGDHLFNMLAAAICAFASERVQTRVLEAEEAGVALTQVGLGMLGLYGWAQRCAHQPSEHSWGGPLR